MKGEAYIYKVSGEIEHREYEATPTLEGLQEAVGGYIETVPYWKEHKGKPCVAFCNEEGKLNKLDLNIKATILWMQSGAFHHVASDVLVGDVIVLQGDDEFMEAM